MLLLLPVPSWAADGPAAPFVGRRVADVIDEYQGFGLPFAYSTNLVSSDLLVETEPVPGTALEIVAQILKPHGLKIRTDSGVHLVVQSASSQPSPEEESSPQPSVTFKPGAMETVIVSASRYAISRDITTSQFSIDQRTIQNMPDVGEDPIRVTQRLPGAAASGGSAIAHFRGGETDEIGIMLNGQWLFDPFHIRDYQNIFSAIDSRAIKGVEVYTGGFPVRYGDRMSGLVLMDSIDSEDRRRNELGISVFSTSLLTAGSSGKNSWLFSARRGNLDLIIDPQYGQPSYFDVFGEFSYEFSPNTRLSVNALFADDAVDVVLEADPAELEQVSSRTRNAQLWLRLESRWSDDLASSTILSAVDFRNRRDGSSNDPEKMIATVEDDRVVSQFGFRQDWVWSPNAGHWTEWGISAMSGEVEYRYDGDAEYHGLQAMYENWPDSVSRSVAASPKGGSYAVYVSDRWQLTEKSIIEWGLRWDDQKIGRAHV